MEDAEAKGYGDDFIIGAGERAAPPGSSSPDQAAPGTEGEGALRPVDAPSEDDMPRFHITSRDTTIKCTCPAGTKRDSKDLEYGGITQQGPFWIHKTCKQPYSASEDFARMLEYVKAKADGKKPKFTSSEDPAIARVQLKNYSSVFHCDGPCKGSRKWSEYFNCKKCCAWQHKPCMLYGEEGDVNGPVCNRCYMSFLLHRDEIVEWQRKRLLQAVNDAWKYLKKAKEDNMGLHWRKDVARKFLARFFYHNQGEYIKFVKRRKQEKRQAALADRLAGNDESSKATKPSSRKRKRSSAPAAESTPSLEEIEEELEAEQLEVEQLEAEQLEAEQLEAEQLEAEELEAEELEEEEPTSMVVDEDDDGSGTGDEIVVAPARKKPAAKRVTSSPQPSSPQSPPSQRQPRKKRVKRESSPPLPALPAPTPSSKGCRASGRVSGQQKSYIVDQAMEVDDDDDDIIEVKAPTRKSTPNAKFLKGPDKRTYCKCSGILVPAAKHCFPCTTCELRQHIACSDDKEHREDKICNVCLSNLPQQETAISSKTPQAAETIDSSLRDEVLNLCSTVLWKEWVAIPSPIDEDEIPPALPPADWLLEAQDRLLELVTASGTDLTTDYLQPVLAAWPRKSVAIVGAIRDLANNQISRGVYKGKRGELGLLLEILGLEEKGSVWDGVA